MIKPMIVYIVPLFGVMPLSRAADAGTLSGGHWRTRGLRPSRRRPNLQQLRFKAAVREIQCWATAIKARLDRP